MRIATWNVNSVRARVGRVTDWLQRADIDVLAMQEIKCKDAQFPHQAFEDAGYEVVTHGLSQWNGVAFASRIGLDDVQRDFPGMPGFGKPLDDGVLVGAEVGVERDQVGGDQFGHGLSRF